MEEALKTKPLNPDRSTTTHGARSVHSNATAGAEPVESKGPRLKSPSGVETSST